MDRRIRLHAFAILLPKVIAGFVTGRLHHVHALRFPCVGFAGFTRLIETADWHDAIGAPPCLVDFYGFLLDTADTDTRNT